MKPEPGPIRVMHVLHRLALGGMEYGVIKVVNRLDRRIIAPSICSLRESAPEARAELAPGVRLHEMHRGDHLDLGLIRSLHRLFRAERVDIVHSHNWSTFAFTVLAARLARVPIIIHGVHGRDTEDLRTTFVRATAERLLARATHHFTTVSSHLRDQIQREWGVSSERILYIPNGVDLSRFGVSYPGAEIRERLGVSSGAHLIGTVGSMREVKDHETLVRAFRIVRQRMPGVKLLLVGQDPSDQFSRKMAQEMSDWESLREDILFLGVRRDVPEILSVLDLYVNSSLYEGMSNSILEAMASSKPVVATAVGGTPDLVRDGATGWLVPSRDPGALARRMEQALNDPDLARKLGQEGRARVERYHSFSAMVGANASLYVWLHARRRRMRRPADQIKIGAARVLRSTGLLALADALSRPSLTILCYHRVLPMAETRGAPAQGMMVAKELFERQAATLARDYRVLSLAEVLHHYESGRPFPRRAVWISFDNGYADNFEHAYPILRRHDLPASIFLVPGAIDTGEWLWWDDLADSLRGLHGQLDMGPKFSEEVYPEPVREALRRMNDLPAFSASESDRVARLLRACSASQRSAVLRDLRERASGARSGPRARIMLTWDEVRQMAETGITFGLHTVGPGTFGTATEDEGVAEIAGAIDRIAAETSVRPIAYSYPIGPSADRIRPWLVRCGIRVAVTSPASGFNYEDSDPLMLGSLSGGYLAVGDEFSRSYMAMEMCGLRVRLARRRTA